MISYIKGIITEKNPTEVVIDVNGIGYQIFISLYTYSKIQHLKEVKLLTHLHIKEDAHSLYGFFEASEKEIFMQLISVSGVGLATARLMLSALSPSEIYHIITQSKTNLLEKVKGIGKKTAERIVLELKDKLLKIKSTPAHHTSPLSTTNNDAPIESIISAADNALFELQHDTIAALTALGIARQQAEHAVQQVVKNNPSIQSIEALLKASLQIISA